jgi:hypothetical protein
MLNSTVKIFGQEIKPKDYAYQAKQYKEKSKMDNVLESKEIDVWMVHIPANIYDGKYYDFRTVRVKVPMDIAKTKDEAIKYVNDNKEAMLADIDKKRAYGGKRYVKAPVEKNVFFKNDYSVVPSKVLVSEASLSKMHGTKKTSYQTLESVKVIVRHHKPVSEEVRGSRTRAIKEIFIERAGERFRFPHNYLAGARAMARHVYEGGKVDDVVGNYIIEQTSNLLKLKEFYRYANSNKLINENSQDIISVVKENANNIKTELKRLQSSRTYESIKARIEENATQVIEEQNADDLKELFTVKMFDEGIGEVLPLVKRLVNEKQAWKKRIEEASGNPFVIVRSQIISEDEIFEFTDPQQKIGYRLQGIVRRVQEESELSRFIGNAANKLVEGQELSEFEKTVVKNVLGNIQIVEARKETESEKEWREQIKASGGVPVKLVPTPQDFRDYQEEEIRKRQAKKKKKKSVAEAKDDEDDDEPGSGKFRDEWGRDTEEQDEWKKNVTGKKNKKVEESTDEIPLSMRQKAAQVSKDHRCVQHIERDPETGDYRLSDWYDCDNTVASYENGRLKESVVDRIAENLDKNLSKFTDLNEIFQKKNYVGPKARIIISQPHTETVDGLTDNITEYEIIFDDNDSLGPYIAGKFWNSEYNDRLSGWMHGSADNKRENFVVDYDYRKEDPYSQAGVVKILMNNPKTRKMLERHEIYF